MFRQSSSREGEQQMNEKLDLVAEKPQIEPALPTPSLDPSSSSSVASLSSHDPNHSNIISASISRDPIAAQIAQLFSLVARLSSENEAHLSSFTRVNAELASLKSENQALRRTVEDQHRVIAELSRAALPDGHWVWETEKDELERARGKEGRWLFSLEKYRPSPPQIAAGPPTSLLSLPVELITTILEPARPYEKRRLLPYLNVSFQIADVVSSILYREVALRSPEEMLLFFESRTSTNTSRSLRISSLFVPQSVDIELDRDDWSDDQLQALQRSRQVRGASFDVNWLHVFLPRATDLFLDTSLFSTVARSYFNPSHLELLPLNPSVADLSDPPSSSVVPLSSTSFLSTWTRLKEVNYSGQGSIILVEGDEKKETVFSGHWRARGQRTVRTFVETRRRIAWGGPEDSERNVEVGISPCEWVEQYVGGDGQRRSFSITEGVGE